MSRWSWALVVIVAVGLMLALAWLDSTVFRGLYPDPLGPPRRSEFRPAAVAVGFEPGVKVVKTSNGASALVGPRLELGGLGGIRGLFGFWWFVALVLGQLLVTLAVIVAVPGRVRRAAERVRPGQVSLLLAAGVASTVLVAAATLLLRATFVLVPVAPVLWAVTGVGVAFGFGTLALALGRALADRLGPVNPLVAAAVAAVILFDLSLIPAVGVAALGLITFVALGVSVVTRLGSDRGWSMEDLR